MGDELTKALPNSHAAWGLRGDACMKLPMGSSIASDHYEKAEALAEGGRSLKRPKRMRAKRSWRWPNS